MFSGIKQSLVAIVAIITTRQVHAISLNALSHNTITCEDYTSPQDCATYDAGQAYIDTLVDIPSTSCTNLLMELSLFAGFEGSYAPFCCPSLSYNFGSDCISPSLSPSVSAAPSSSPSVSAAPSVSKTPSTSYVPNPLCKSYCLQQHGDCQSVHPDHHQCYSKVYGECPTGTIECPDVDKLYYNTDLNATCSTCAQFAGSETRGDCIFPTAETNPVNGGLDPESHICMNYTNNGVCPVGSMPCSSFL